VNANASAGTSDRHSLMRSVYWGGFGYGLAGDDILVRNWTSTELNSDLPVGIEVSKCQVLAFNSVDYATADILGVDNARHHFIKGCGE
jgi:hypothetical protein